ncbi:MAG: nickel-responsive transcriptional regulator NikR [Candidatus Kryptonium sp.]|nr:nickel-responsive transcriptional regulator NikR [Candidatus Kryptonium sp.]MCX7761328.1 nickel-responsive transcriptional regulator NikR [Candidatus Kryptonium sp.]MDW8109890.1 nickel-responsive transcriptional regulator NikR [Candidatus Kryptonium sp.]
MKENKYVVRFGVSMENELLEKFDKLIQQKGYTNRSEAIRDLIREKLVEQAIEKNKICFGIFSFVYDHRKRELEEKLTDFQHEHFNMIISTTHIHIDQNHCLEVVIMKGKSEDLKKITDKVLSFKGVENGKLVLTTV